MTIFSIPIYSTIVRILSTILCILLYKSFDDAEMQLHISNSLSLKIANPVALVLASNANKYINAPPFLSILYFKFFIKSKRARLNLALFKCRRFLLFSFYFFVIFSKRRLKLRSYLIMNFIVET